MNGEEFREALRRGDTVYGTMLTLAHGARWAAVFGRLGFDYVIIDTEHSPFGRHEVGDMSAALAAVGVTPIVRIPYPDPHQARIAIDAGGHGVLAPYVERPEDARAIVAAARLRPLKGALHDAARDEGHYVNPETEEYLGRFNRRAAVIIGIESVPALERLDAILAVPGIDAIFIGPHDLSISLGVPEQYDHPRFQEAVGQIIAQSQARGLPAGGHWMQVEQVRHWMGHESRFILYNMDARAMSEGYRRDLLAIKGTAGEAERHTI